jgi:hypothetical protein
LTKVVEGGEGVVIRRCSRQFDLTGRDKDRIKLQGQGEAGLERERCSSVRIRSTVSAVRHGGFTVQVQVQLDVWESRGIGGALCGLCVVSAKLLVVPGLNGRAPHPSALGHGIEMDQGVGGRAKIRELGLGPSPRARSGKGPLVAVVVRL